MASGNDQFTCDICNISVNSAQILEDHTRGKKHQKNMELQSSENYCKTVRVLDFPPGQYAQEMLWAYFEKYGPLDDVDIDYWNPGVAYVTYKRPGSAVTCLNQKRHVMDDYDVYVEPVNISFAPPKPKEPKKKKEEAKKTPVEVTEKMLQEASVQAQMSWLTRELEMKVMDSTVHKNLVDNLQEIFTSYFPGCIVYRFGSSLNGLGIRGCDLDVFLDLNLDKPLTAQQARKLPRPYPNVMEIESFSRMRGKFMSRDELSRVPLQDQVRLCSKILQAEGLNMGLADIQTIPSQRCPMVRFKHGPSSVHMDMTLNNRVALRNTQLLLLYQQIEPRFRQIMFAVRQWARNSDLQGTQNIGTKLTSYAMTMLCVFYLQNTKPPVLPTVDQLADLATGDDKMTVYNWDCSFTSNKSLIKASENKANAVDLLCGFFEFYSNFDFVNRMVSPRTGRAMPLADLAVEFKASVLTHFRISPICVQDPFVLDHNVALNVNELTRKTVLTAFKTAEQKVKSSSFTTPSEMQAWGLPYLFSSEAAITLSVADTALPGKLTKHLISVPMTFGSCPKLFTIAVTLQMDLNESWCQYVGNAFQYILENLLFAEVEILLDRTQPKLKIGEIEVDENTGMAKPGSKRSSNGSGDAAGAKKKKTEEMETDEEEVDEKYKARIEEATSDASMLLLLKCKVFDKVWINRKNFAGKAALKNADLDFERAVTKQLIDSGDAKMYCPMEFLVEVRHKLDPCQVICGLELTGDQSSKSEFNTFAAFLEVFHVKVMNQL